MIKTNVYSTYQNNYYDNSVQRKENKAASNAEDIENKNVSKTEASGNTSQVELSSKAKSVLEQLAKKYSNMDFFVADFANGDDAKEIMSRGTKEFSVLFSPEELEKMASDEKYLQEKMEGIEGAVRMSEQINEQFGFESTFGNNTAATGSIISKIGISFNDDGSVSYFAELEKSSAKQRERIEQAREKRAEEKKEAAKKEKAKEREVAVSGKRVTVEASSEEELIQKITQIDWSEIKEERQEVSGSRFDYSI